MHKVIAFTGPMGAGKSEAIQALKDYLKEKDPSTEVILVKFAQPLYDIQEFIYNRCKLEQPKPKDRLLLQWLGTEWGRKTKSESLWVNIWTQEVEEIRKGFYGRPVVIVCDDCRFDNEAVVVKQAEGVIVKISTNRNGERIDTSRSAHESERGIDNKFVDYVIENNGTLDEYKNQLTYLFNKLAL